MDDTIDLLRIKIEKAKRELPLETVNAIDAVDWRASILGLRSKFGYTFEQLGDLETETELLLAGLVSAKDYPKELENRMKISKAQANELVNEMNNLVFKKIREELVKNTERKKILPNNSPLEEYPRGGGGQSIHPGASATPQEGNKEEAILHSAGIEIIPEKLELGVGPVEKPLEQREDILKTIEKKEEVIHPILTEKLSGPSQILSVRTEHTLENISKPAPSPASAVPQAPKIDPYREPPE